MVNTANQAIMIASGVLASLCTILSILLVYLIRAFYRQRPYDDIHSPLIPPYKPDFSDYSPQPLMRSISYPLTYTTKEIDLEESELKKYGIDMGGFYLSRRPTSVSEDEENTSCFPNPATAGKPTSEKHGKTHDSSGIVKKKLHRTDNSLDPATPNPILTTSGKSLSPKNASILVHRPSFDDPEPRNYHIPLHHSISLENLNTLGKPSSFNSMLDISSPSINKRRVQTMKNVHSPKPFHARLARASSERHRRTPRSLSPAVSTSSGSRGPSPCPSEENIEVLAKDSENDERPSMGEILISLCHNPSQGKLTVTIKSARHLPGWTKTGKIDPFIKLLVYSSGERIYKKKTTIKHDSNTPNYDESFDFVVTRDRMHVTSVILRLYHHGQRANVFSKNILVGVVFLGYQFEIFGPHPFSLDHGARHWASIIEKPHLPVEEWHPIQPCSISGEYF